MNLSTDDTPERLFQTGARLSDGKTALWHVPAHSHEGAAQQIRALKDEPTPLVVLVCIPGGKQ